MTPGWIPATILGYSGMVLLALILGWGSGVGFPSWGWHSEGALLATVSALGTCLASRLLGRTGLFDVMIEEIGGALRGLKAWEILVVAGCSAVGEEWLFRGVLQSWIGVAWATGLFAALHFPYRPGLWPWPVFAFLVGAWMAWLQLHFGTLLVPALFHALVNAGNLHWILSITREE